MTPAIIMFINVLAWFGVAFGVIRVLAHIALLHHLNTPAGALEQNLAAFQGQRIVPKPMGVVLVILAVSVAWLISRLYT